jgi:hypothetical protein
MRSEHAHAKDLPSWVTSKGHTRWRPDQRKPCLRLCAEDTRTGYCTNAAHIQGRDDRS